MGNGRHAERGGSRIARGVPVLTDDPTVLTRCDAIDLIVEVTGTVDFGASVVLDAFKYGKPVVLVNAELDSLIGPILKSKADQAGVVLTHTDGDEPGVAMTLFRYVQSVGLRPVAAGNIKGMVDYYRTPDTQREFAARNDQDVKKVTSFADAPSCRWKPRCSRMQPASPSAAAEWLTGLCVREGACATTPRRERCSPAESLTTRSVRGTAHRWLRRCSRRKSAQENAVGVLQARRWPLLCFLYAVPPAPPSVAFDDRPRRSSCRSHRRPCCGTVV